jgi:hypothetical protein
MGYYNSFVLRVWSDDRGTMRGTIEHVGTRDSLAFVEPERIRAFLRAHVAVPPDRSDGGKRRGGVGADDD